MTEFYKAPASEPIEAKRLIVPFGAIMFNMAMLAIFYGIAYTVNIFPKLTILDLFTVFVSIALPFGLAFVASLLMSLMDKQNPTDSFYICVKWSSTVYGALLFVINILSILKIIYNADNVFDAFELFIANL